MVFLFVEGTFNKYGVISKVDLNLKYFWDQCRSELERAMSHENPPLITEMEWRALTVYP